MSKRAGIFYLKVNGNSYDAKGNFSYNLGQPMREAIVGADGIHGYKETPQVAFIEGEITDQSSLDLAALLLTDDATATLELANGKLIGTLLLLLMKMVLLQTLETGSHRHGLSKMILLH